MAFQKKPRFKDSSLRRFLSVALGTFVVVGLMVLLVKTNSNSSYVAKYLDESQGDLNHAFDFNYTLVREILKLPKQNDFSIQLEKRNQLPPRNIDRFPKLAKDHIIIVLYVHNRPQYLQVVVESLSRVVGISETLLIVSHDGYFEEMNKIVEGIEFCQVKQIFAPFSPHVFTDGFPGASPEDCKDKDDGSKSKKKGCRGNPDQYGNHRSPKIVSLKHHWWWMMNTVWDGLKETRAHLGHVLFIEEDHFIFPNAYRNLQVLVELKPKKCPSCYAVNLAPSDVDLKGDGWEGLVAERMGNVGYAFNRTVWRKIHKKARGFCAFDDYNWDITMWATVYPSFGAPVYTLRGSRTSAVHFGKCGLHQGQGENENENQNAACVDNGVVNIELEKKDKVVNIKPEWDLFVFEHQSGYQAGFKGWGGWGDERDHQLCLKFAHMYLLMNNAAPF